MKFLFLALLAVAAYKGYEYIQRPSVEPLYDAPYLVVYGRDACGFTVRTVRELTSAGVRFVYQSVDDDGVADLLHARMDGKGIDTRRYNLPVVDLNNSISVRPDNDRLIRNAKDLAL